MSTLVVIGYKDLYQAKSVFLKLWKLQKDYRSIGKMPWWPRRIRQGKSSCIRPLT